MQKLTLMLFSERRKMATFDPTKFIAPDAKPLPVILLLDVSGSMQGAKIQNLNIAVKDMVETFKNTENGEIEIHVAILTFGAEVKLHQVLASAGCIKWYDLSASGGTPLGTVFKMAKAMIEDKNVVPSRAYRPTVILVSDGQPTDKWEQPLNDFIDNGRSSKCDRMAMAIGADADEGVLRKFVKGSKNPLFYAENAKHLSDFFQFVTMSTMIRTQSQDPNALPDSSNVSIKPVTIDLRKEKLPQPPQQSGTVAKDNQANEGYW